MKINKLAISLVTTTVLFLGGGVLSVSADSNQTSVVDYLNNNNRDSSFDNRKNIAMDMDIKDYAGTMNQNIEMLDNFLENTDVKADSTVSTSKNENTDATNESKSVNGQTLNMTATAYTAHCSGCSGVTRTGVNLLDNPNKNVVAVDPNVIPLGSKVYIEGYGYAYAEDTGSAINGNKIDLFISNEQKAQDYGVQNVEVTIID